MVVAESGARLPADLVILAIGVRPETGLARRPACAIGPRGGIVVDAQMRTSDPRIWAVGDVVEVRDVVTGTGDGPAAGRPREPSGPGRGGGDRRTCRPTFAACRPRPSWGSSGLTVASTGASEKGLRRAGVTNFEKSILHPGHHAGYYPGAQAHPSQAALLGP